MLPILRFGVCRSSDLSIHVQRIFPRTNALLQPSLGAMTALPMTDFHRTQISLHGSNTLEIQLLSEFCPASLRFQIRQGLQTYGRFLPCPGLSPDSLVQRTRMRVRLLGSRICHKSHAIQLFICTPYFWHAKRPLLLS